MNDHIKSLQEALQVSPDNVPLRLHLAEVLLREKMYGESAAQYSEVLQRSYGNAKAKLGLAEAWFYQQKYSAAIIIYEELYPDLPSDAMVFFVKCLIKEHSLQQAVEVLKSDTEKLASMITKQAQAVLTASYSHAERGLIIIFVSNFY